MKIRYFCFAVGAIGISTIMSTVAARADVSWEHKATIRLGNKKQPAVRLKIFNNWSGQRHRLLFKYVASNTPPLPMPGGPFPMTTLAPTMPSDSAPLPAPAAPRTSPGSSHTGGIAFIHRLGDDDRLIYYATELRSYVSEPLHPLLARLRFDPWQKIAPELSKQPPPSLTPEQRKRLGAEVRALVKPYMREFWRMYFRPLKEKRTFNGIPGRGYRLTSLFNIGGPGKSEWARMNFEWWLAETMTGDEIIHQFLQSARDIRNDPKLKSTSMWLNEYFPVMWQMMPAEFHQAAESLMPGASDATAVPNAGFGGTPLYVAVTLIPPPLQQALTGDARVEIVLQSRNTGNLPANVFDVPSGYERVPLEPFFKKFDEMKKTMPKLPTTLVPLD